MKEESAAKQKSKRYTKSSKTSSSGNYDGDKICPTFSAANHSGSSHITHLGYMLGPPMLQIPIDDVNICSNNQDSSQGYPLLSTYDESLPLPHNTFYHQDNGMSSQSSMTYQNPNHAMRTALGHYPVYSNDIISKHETEQLQMHPQSDMFMGGYSSSGAVPPGLNSGGNMDEAFAAILSGGSAMGGMGGSLSSFDPSANDLYSFGNSEWGFK